MAFPWTPSKEGKKMARRKKRTLLEDFEMSGKPKRRKKRSGKKTIKKAAPKRARRSKKAKTSKPKRKK